MLMNGTHYWARRRFKYAGTPLARGQIFQLKGVRNDEKLVRLGYIMEWKDTGQVIQCAECGVQFIDNAARTNHGDIDHEPEAPIFLAPGQPGAETPEGIRMVKDDGLRGGGEDTTREDREDKKLDAEAPLFMENTEASRKAGLGAIELGESNAADFTPNPEAAVALKKSRRTGKKAAKKKTKKRRRASR